MVNQSPQTDSLNGWTVNQSSQTHSLNGWTIESARSFQEKLAVLQC